MKPDRHFRPEHRLRKPEDFDRVFRDKCSVRGNYLRLYAVRNTLTHPRLGRIVSKRWGNAVKRNRLRRWMREAFRELKSEMNAPLDLLVMPIKVEGLTCALLHAELASLIHQISCKPTLGS